MRRKFRKKLAPLLFFMSEHKSFWAKRKKLLGSIIGGANYPKGAYGADWRKPTKPTRAKDSRGSLVYGYPLARQRACRTSPKLQAHYPLRGLMYNNERPHSALNYEPPSSLRRPHEGDTNQFNLESINTINNNINQVTLLLLLPALIWGTQQFKPP